MHEKLFICFLKKTTFFIIVYIHIYLSSESRLPLRIFNRGPRFEYVHLICWLYHETRLGGYIVPLTPPPPPVVSGKIALDISSNTGQICMGFEAGTMAKIQQHADRTCMRLSDKDLVKNSVARQ